ncbi:regulator of Vps4 activity in the MVB pathway-domain-containing protein [Pisolithus orientalis]|uniref:regulator of Vps4 activity in the MVB pathway-domain-containing protein n=1 Tax=Pisolithus orientalis TaxID=936130 RepID=UPI0022252ADA|nr:regulator of Vps4 activity in the MVB pathway-domain-containing protein [Pisolithus orientalis]KAI6028901.1 regulator of Vps4 activity in the MVB pathway-domain-containing protein [Pisolithus orientalis]
MASWDPTLLRTTSHRLGQLQERKDSQSQITRRDIATLLHNGNVGLARAKAQNLMWEDRMGDLLEVLEMCVCVVLERVAELENGKQLSPVTTEAASTIVYAAPSAESKDLSLVRDVLVQRLGRTFAHSAVANSKKTVAKQVLDILSSSAPTAAQMDACLVKIADTYNVKWTPQPRRPDILDQLSEILDLGSSTVVDLSRLRRLCSHGLPDDPPWIRPRIWRLLFGTLPVSKSTWEKESQKQRESYYDLVRRLLGPLSSLPPPTTPPARTDAAILKVSESLFHLPFELFSRLEDEPENFTLCPLDEEAEEAIKIDCARNLDVRLELIRRGNTEPELQAIPEIRLEHEVQAEPPDQASGSVLRFSRLRIRKHLSALFRLLYLHICLNPANQAPHVPALLIPLYSALTREIEPADAAHAEADTFWLFEALVGELVELEDEQGGKVWMRRFSERLANADGELAENLVSSSLAFLFCDDSRWLSTLLTQTLPLPAVFPVWDVIFSCPMRTRNSNPKLDCLVDICVSLLIRAAHAVVPVAILLRLPGSASQRRFYTDSCFLRLGKQNRQTPSLWSYEHAALPPPSPLRPWELSDAFMEGMALLQAYPIDAAGGIDRVLQTAFDVSQKRLEEEAMRVQKADGMTLGARLKATMWKGLGTPLTGNDGEEREEESDEEETTEGDSEHDDGNETETPGAKSLTSMFANTVWRDTVSHDAIVPFPSPPSLAEEEKQQPSVQPVQTALWNYAGKLKDSDTIAAFSKVSTNWRAKAMNAWSSRRGSNASSSVMDVSSPRSTSSELAPPKGTWLDSEPERLRERGSLSGTETGKSKDPPRPAFFRSPRESFLPLPRRQALTEPSSPSPELSPRSDKAFIHKTKESLASIASLQTRPAPPTKSAPRPLLLNSQTLMISKKSPSSGLSGGRTPPSHMQQWSDAHLPKGHATRQESVSSISSLSLSEVFNKTYSRSAGARSDYDSDGSSRRVPLNRKSVSPMALASRSPRLPWGVLSPAHSSDTSISSIRGLPLASGSIAEETAPERGWRPADGPDSPTTVPSPPNPPTPLNQYTTPVRINGIDRVAIAAGDSGHASLELPGRSGAIVRKRTPPPVRAGNEVDDTSDSSNARLRSKRYTARPANLRIRDTLKPNTTTVVEQQKGASPRSLAPPEWPEEQELTPRAGNFGATSPVSPRRSPARKSSHDMNDMHGHVRTRKVSTGSRDSAAEEGDDEGYDGLLSAYESEE